MRVLFALPGFHRYDRGAEIAFLSLATELARSGTDVTVIGSGGKRPAAPYNYIRAGAIARERFESFPRVPLFRGETSYEEASFVPGLLRHYDPRAYDITATCSYPFTNWVLRRPAAGSGRPPHVFVTQNGDWPAWSGTSEYRWFGCEGLVCTNPDYLDRNRERWRCALIPNGIDLDRFRSGPAERAAFGLPADAFVVLMVSALIPSKRVAEGVLAVSRIPGAYLLVAGDGPLRQEIGALAGQSLPGRFLRVTVTPDRMPALYRSADVFLHLSKDESFGNVYVEALACGLPVVAHETRRVRWIVGDQGLLLDTDDADAVAAALLEAKASAAASRATRVERAEAFGWKKVAAQYRDFFQEVLQARPSGRGRAA